MYFREFFVKENTVDWEGALKLIASYFGVANQEKNELLLVLEQNYELTVKSLDSEWLLLQGLISNINEISQLDLILIKNFANVGIYDEVLFLDEETKRLGVARFLNIKNIYPEYLFKTLELFVKNLIFWINQMSLQINSAKMLY